MLPCLGQRLAASPKQGHFDKFDEWKSYLPAVFADNGARALPTKAAPYGSAKTFRRPALFGREMPAKQIDTHVLRMEEVSAYGARQPWYLEGKVGVPRKPTAFPQAKLSGIANVYSCCVPAAPFHITCCHRQGGCIRTQPQAVLACGAIDLAESATRIIQAFPR